MKIRLSPAVIQTSGYAYVVYYHQSHKYSNVELLHLKNSSTIENIVSRTLRLRGDL